MSDERKKIKELADELGVGSKDVLAAARDLGIPAKVAGSSVSEAEAARLRNKISPPPEPDRQEVRVRRRPRAAESGTERRAADGAAPEMSRSPAAEAPETTPETTPETQLPPADDDTQRASAAVEDKTETAAPRAGKRERRRGGKETPPARIVSMPARTATTGQAGPAPDPLPEPLPADAAPVAPEPAAATPEVPAAPQREERRRSAPARGAAFSAEPERHADGRAISSAPLLSARPDADGGREDNADTAGVRVISRPDAAKTPGAGRPRPAPGARRTAPGGRPGTAGAAARPDRPDRPGQRKGPARAGGAGAAKGAPSLPPQEGEQARRNRGKGRRTVEFAGRGRAADDDRGWSRTVPRRKARKSKEVAPLGGTQPVKAVKRKIRVDEFIRVSDLAHQMGLKSGEIIRVLFGLGIMATINQSMDIDTAVLVAGEFGYEIEKTGFSEQDIIDAQQGHFDENREDYVVRPPVVTIMGHVDHGKTSLLDAVRKSSVASGEAGGITQHIGAYHVKTKKGEIVFLDTPGHEAFTAMRARGAEVTDIVVLVVAADDGVMEQTREAVSHARAAGVPIMVAVNKIDKPGADTDRVRRELSELGLVSEEWGGDTTFSYVSAKTRQGLDELLEVLALQAEILELKANPKRPALGHIVEARLDKGRGALGTVLIQQGALKLGDSFICGVHSGRVRAMFNDQGKKVKEAGPSMPVEVQGFEGVPEAGEEFIVITDEKSARRIAESRTLKQRDRELAKESRVTLETFLARKAGDTEARVLSLVIKADVQGSLEAIGDALLKLSTDKVRIGVIHGGTGAVSESDVLLASASEAIIIGFNVRPSVKARELAEQEKVDIRFYDIIYKLVEDVRGAMEGMLAPVEREVFLGTAEVRELFTVPKIGVIAGCRVADGKIVRNAGLRLLRDGVVVHNGKVSSLRRFKDDVREVVKGYECGIGIDNFNDLKVGDVIEAFETVEEAATL
ncbi:MAG: translation initiation factor IF-2 [Desulfovibrio sp.]|jgi:translation initiation factor IF-2|nr:translation initiation factor IF-2 [Desulfovibrio sp.]